MVNNVQSQALSGKLEIHPPQGEVRSAVRNSTSVYTAARVLRQQCSKLATHCNDPPWRVADAATYLGSSVGGFFKHADVTPHNVVLCSQVVGPNGTTTTVWVLLRNYLKSQEKG